MTMYGFHKLTSTLKSMEGINSDERYFEGLLTVQMKDKQGEVTIVDELYKVLPVWIDRGAPISDTHTNRIVGKGINYSRTTVKSDDGAILPAIKITGKIFKNYELDNVIWNKIKNNEYKGLSFGGATRSARSPIKMKDGSTAYALSDLEHYEVAVCADPAVPMAIITDFNQIAKANFDSTVRDDGKMVIQCSKMGCYVKKDSLVKIEDDEDDNTQVTVLDEWKNETHPDKNGKTEGIRTTKADEDKPLNKPMRDDGDKKFKVYVKDPKTGKTVTVRFGDPNMEIKRDDPERRASFRARHDCDNAKDITTPKYWSCKMWEKETSVTDHTTKSDLLTVMEGDKPENYKAVEAGKQRGRAIDKTDEEDKDFAIRERNYESLGAGGGKADTSLLLDTDENKKKMVEKKEMLEAVIGNPNEKKPTQTVSGERKEVTSGYKTDLEKAIELVNKAGYQVYTEDRNNGTGINDLQREIPEECNPLRTSQQLPMDIQQANLKESQTFEQKVQALIAEGKSRESAEKIVGSFVHKVEASSGSGGAGIGDANNVNGGTMTTQTGGANNPVHNNGCDCTCKDCKRNDRCDCCEKCKKKSRGLDISNTGGGGTTEQAFNQNPPNAQRLNNKSDDGEEGTPDNVPDEVVELTEGGQKVHDDAARYVRSQHYIKSTMRVNKVHALLVLNKVRDKGIFGQTKIQKPIDAHVGNSLSQPFGRKNTKGNKEMSKRERRGREQFRRGNNIVDLQGTKEMKETKEDLADVINITPVLPKKLEKALAELIKKLPKKLTDYDREDTWQAPDEIDDEHRIHTDVHGLRRGENRKRHGNNSGAQRNSIVQGTGESGENDVASGLGDRLANTGNHGDGAAIQATLSRRNANIMRSNKALSELKKLQISGGLGGRGLGSAAGYTQGTGQTTQITLVQPRPTDDRVEAKCIPKKITKVRRNEGQFGSDVGGTGSTSTAVSDENTKYMDVNGNPHSTSAEAEAVPARKRMNRRLSRQRAADYKADTRSTIGDRLKE